MKAQLSLEFLAYLFIAGLSLLVLAAFLRQSAPKALNLIAGSEIESFVSEINGQIAAERFYLPLQVYVPGALCNSTINGSTLSTAYGAFRFLTNVSISSSIICKAGDAEISIIPENGSVEVV